LHYGASSPLGISYLTLERALARRTDLFLFESEYGLATFRAKVGAPDAPARVVHNGVRPGELVPITPDPDAADVAFVGELRHLKGVEVWPEPFPRLITEGKVRSAILFGEGPDAATYRADVARRGLSAAIIFGGIKPAREAFRRGRVLAVPSRAES